MTAFAENQLDLHRKQYYRLSVWLFPFFNLSIQREIYGRIMTCYEQPRLTNEETDACAANYRQFMAQK